MYFRWVILLPALLGALASCALQSSQPADRGLASVELQRVLSGDALLDTGQPLEPLRAPPLLGLNNEMRAFLDTHVADSKNQLGKLRNLLRAISNPQSMGFNYQPLTHHNATDAFHYREGNCLSFTSMFISLAREKGINIAFNEVDIPGTWNQASETTFIFYRHINAIAKINKEKYAVDVNMANYNQAYPQRKISDQYAEAHYYNNIAMRYFFASDIQAAFIHLRKAIELAPDQAYLWSNMGTIYRRAKKFTEAQIAYEHSLALDTGTGIAASNLGHMYQQLGEPAKAAEYSQQARLFRLNNPYYRLHLAKKAYAEQRLQEALTHIKAAIKKHKKDYRFYTLAADINRELGNTRAARSLRKKAAQLTAEKQPSPGTSTYQGLPGNKLAL